MIMYKAGKFLLCALAFFSLCSFPGHARAEQPLTLEGKKTVFQRVVSNPGARLLAGGDSNSQVISTPKTFTSFYVYERKGDMLRVGVGANKSDGWLKTSESTEWPQAITMVFTDPLGRQPVLFFRDHDQILKACKAENIKNYLSQYVTLFSEKARIPDDCPVLAMEPTGKDGSIAQQSFYLMPVLNIDTQFKDSGTQLLQVASVDPGSWQSDKSGVPPSGSTTTTQAKGNDSSKNNNMKTAIAFVIDTTISMKPYIDQTVNVIKQIFDAMQKSTAKDNVAVAVVAFRSSMEQSPGIEYTTKIVSDFKTVSSRKELETMLSQVREATASTHSFDEDSLAGVKAAIDKLSWADYNGRSILLITDAGPLGADDPTSQTGMSPEGMADYLRTNKIYLTAMHVKTPSGKKDHQYAEQSYVELAKLSDNRSSYLSIDASTPQKGARDFHNAASAMALTYKTMVEQVMANAEIASPSGEEVKPGENLEDKAKRLAEATGYAMRLQFAGNAKGTAAPKVVDAWIADADLTLLEKNPSDAAVPVVYPAVLLTKSQLSKLREQVKSIVTTAENAFLEDNDSFNFYEQLVSAAAQMSRDPTQFSQDPKANLAQRGVLLEVLDGLPYKSRILGLQKDDWLNMSTGEKREFIKRLKGLIKRYDEYDRDLAHWESFGVKDSSQWVYRVPLNMLP